jgi:hypothetical protein
MAPGGAVLAALALSAAVRSSPTPRAEPLSADVAALINATAQRLNALLTSDMIEYRAIEEAAASFTDYLGNATTRRFTVAVANQSRLLERAYDFVDLVSARCQAKPVRRVVFLLLSLIREFTLVGKERAFVCRMPVLIGVVESCADTNFFKLIVAVIVASIDLPAGGLCLNGAGPGLFAFVNTTEFGAVEWEILSIYAIWADQMAEIAPPDRGAMCALSDRMFRNRAKWDAELNKYYCWLAKNVRCPGVSDRELAELCASAECAEFLRQTDKIVDGTL